MNLFELSSKYQQLMANLLDVDEITPAMEDEMRAIDDQVDDKVLNYAGIIKSFEAQAEDIGDAIKKMNDRKRSFENKAEHLRQIVAVEMERMEKDKIEDVYHLVRLRKALRVDVFDRKQIPEEYQKVRVTKEPDKTLIKVSIEQGIAVPGAKLALTVEIR